MSAPKRQRPRGHLARRGGGALPPRGGGDEALAYFLREIHGTPVLTAAEERHFARGIRDARDGLRGALAHVPGAARRLACAWRERAETQRVPELLSERYELAAPQPADLAEAIAAIERHLPASLRCPAAARREAAREALAEAFERFDPRTPLLVEWSRALDAALAEHDDRRLRWGLPRDALSAWAREAARHREAYLEARRAFASHNLRLVVHIAKDFRGQGADLADLIQDGNVGLLRAVEKFDERRGFRFSTYAGWWIVQALQRSVRRDAHPIAIPDDLIADRRRLLECEARSACSRSDAADPSELGARAGIPPQRLARLLASPSRAVALDAPFGAGDERTLADVLPDGGEDPVARLTTAARAACVPRLLAHASPRERRVLRARFGLGGAPERTLQELAEELGLSRERVRQIEQRALERLAHAAAAEGLA